ncbi:nucleic acid dioxygenase ALKBH1 isoform X2 [Macrobrachium rosenbergii]|uniref:nucleic acid dioxygenase ALKBH1 isoform X2 n=1 Tax=Macrobrachium rosenbergii TaxID=79674 RepID=UPI0034D78190
MEDTVDIKEDNFKEVFKFYKRRKPPPSFKDVLQVNDAFQEGHHIPPRSLSVREKEEIQSLGLVPPEGWQIFSFVSHPDLLLVRNPFSENGQLKWIEACLREYPQNPNKTNLESCNITLSDSSWWDLATFSEGKKNNLLKKLRWVTLGYHHNWDTKQYSENMKGLMPQDLKRLCSLVAKVLGFQDFVAEAAIINFYHENSTLGPHTDNSEPNMSAPLLSFSFGQSAIFLIGGTTKQTRPTAIFLHSGDILVMAGATRQAFHAVPRIVLVEKTPWIAKSCDNSDSKNNDVTGVTSENKDNYRLQGSIEVLEEHALKYEVRKDILNYVKTSRININVRQVLKPTMQSLF